MEKMDENSVLQRSEKTLGENAKTAEGLLRPDGPALLKHRVGFMKGQITVPNDIKTMFAEEIEKMFYGEE